MRHHNSPTPHCEVDEKVEAHLPALAGSPAPEGHDQWTLRLLADKTVELGLEESLSYETEQLHLKNTLKPWRQQQRCIPRVSAEFVAQVEDVLDPVSSTGQALNAEPYDPRWPVVSFDEITTQLLWLRREDYE